MRTQRPHTTSLYVELIPHASICIVTDTGIDHATKRSASTMTLESYHEVCAMTAVARSNAITICCCPPNDRRQYTRDQQTCLPILLCSSSRTCTPKLESITTSPKARLPNVRPQAEHHKPFLRLFESLHLPDRVGHKCDQASNPSPSTTLPEISRILRLPVSRRGEAKKTSEVRMVSSLRL
jgi:hypothetical protein